MLVVLGSSVEAPFRQARVKQSPVQQELYKSVLKHLRFDRVVGQAGGFGEVMRFTSGVISLDG